MSKYHLQSSYQALLTYSGKLIPSAYSVSGKVSISSNFPEYRKSNIAFLPLENSEAIKTSFCKQILCKRTSLPLGVIEQHLIISVTKIYIQSCSERIFVIIHISHASYYYYST